MEKNILRQFPPCPIFDTAKTERWLEDMAKEGWHPEDYSDFFGYYIFRKAPSQCLHYRLEVVVNPQSFWDGDPKTPQDEALALHEEFGWQFLRRIGEFFLYKSEEPAPRELHTDPKVQALTLKMLNRRIWKSIFSGSLIAAFNIFFGAFGYPLTDIALLGTGFFVCFLLVMLDRLREHYEAVYHTRRYRKQLQEASEPLSTNWRGGARKYRRQKITGLVITGLFFLALCPLPLYRNAADTPLDQVQGPLPFITLEDMDPAGNHGTLNKIDNATCNQWSDLLFPVVVDYLDGGNLEENGEQISGGLLEVQYFEALSPSLARGIAREFTRFYSHQTFGSRSVEVQPLEGLGLDYAMGLYTERFGLMRVVLAEGNRAICARFSLDDETGPYTIENWTALMARNLRGE